MAGTFYAIGHYLVFQKLVWVKFISNEEQYYNCLDYYNQAITFDFTSGEAGTEVDTKYHEKLMSFLKN